MFDYQESEAECPPITIIAVQVHSIGGEFENFQPKVINETDYAIQFSELSWFGDVAICLQDMSNTDIDFPIRCGENNCRDRRQAFI